MTSAKLLTAVEPVIRYQRGRFRGGSIASPGSPRYELGLQLKQDVVHRLVDVWATGEASAALGFEAARVFDQLDPLEKQKAESGGARHHRRHAPMKAMRAAAEGRHRVPARRAAGTRRRPAGAVRRSRLRGQRALPGLQAVEHRATARSMMREAVSLMGGYGITEDCPGFLGHKWMDSQLEATYEGPEAVQRRQLSVTMTDELFLAQFRDWIREMRLIANDRPGTGACALATAMQMWLWTLQHLQKANDADGGKLYQSSRQGVTFPLADALCWLLASRCQILRPAGTGEARARDPTVAEGLPGLLGFLTDLCHVQAARAAGEVGRVCAELVFGYNRHPAWDTEGCATCYQADDLERMESADPGHRQPGARVHRRHREPTARTPPRPGPCVRFDGLEQFSRPARAHGRLPDRLAARQGSRRRRAHQGHDSRSAGLPRMSEPESDRQTMDVDIVCVGFGPATAGFLTTLLATRWHRSSPAPAGALLRARRRYRLRRLRRGDARPRHPRVACPIWTSARSRWPRRSQQEKVVYLLDPHRRQPPLAAAARWPTALSAPSGCARDAVELPYIPPFLHKAGRPGDVARPVPAVGGRRD